MEAMREAARIAQEKVTEAAMAAKDLAAEAMDGMSDDTPAGKVRVATNNEPWGPTGTQMVCRHGRTDSEPHAHIFDITLAAPLPSYPTPTSPHPHDPTTPQLAATCSRALLATWRPYQAGRAPG